MAGLSPFNGIYRQGPDRVDRYGVEGRHSPGGRTFAMRTLIQGGRFQSHGFNPDPRCWKAENMPRYNVASPRTPRPGSPL